MSKAWDIKPDGVVLYVRVTPKGGRDAINGFYTDDAGRTYLAVRVSSPPQDGAANDAVRRLIARQAGIARSAVTIEAGQQAREKRLKLVGEPNALVRWLETLGTTE